MKILIRELLAEHYQKSGEYITQKMLADEMVKAKIYDNVHSAQNMIQYNINGKSKSLDIELLNFLMKRFSKTLNDIIR